MLLLNSIIKFTLIISLALCCKLPWFIAHETCLRKVKLNRKVTYSIEYSKVAVEKVNFLDMPGEFISLAHGKIFQFTTIKNILMFRRVMWGYGV